MSFFSFEPNIYMITKTSSNGKRHYTMHVSLIACLNFLYFALSYALEAAILGRSVELRTPLKNF